MKGKGPIPVLEYRVSRLLAKKKINQRQWTFVGALYVTLEYYKLSTQKHFYKGYSKQVSMLDKQPLIKLYKLDGLF